jgi:hypothetical protein
MSSRRNAKQAARTGRTDARRAGVAAGTLDVLSTGHGHMKVTITPGDEAEQDKARRMIEDMLKRGFSIFVELDDGTTRRVKKFDAKRLIYYIDPPDEIAESEPTAAAPAPKAGKGAKATKRPYKAVPVAGARATAVGRSAGG